MIKLKEGDHLEGQIEFYTNGMASLKNPDKEIFIHKKNTKNSLHLDTVKIELFIRDNKLEGKVIEVLSRFKTQFVGRVHISAKNAVFVIPDNNKIPVDFYIKGGLVAENHQKVVVEFTKWNDSKSPQGKIINILGNSGDNNTEMNSIMAEHGLPTEFPQEVINESELVPEIITNEEISRRLDLRNIITIGIDPFDSKDADDTIGLEVIDDGYIVYINIADVTHYIKPDTELDKEAYRRGTSVYLVDRVIPMFPNRLSNNICSLKSGSDKLSFSVIITFDKNGKIKDRWFGRTIINVNKDYSYEQAQDVIENGSDGSDTDSIILELDKIAKIMRKKRVKDSLDFNSSEVKFILDKDNKKPIGLYFKEQKDANKLIEEYMLLANKEVAKFIKSKELPCVNRVHPPPDDEKLLQLKRIALNFGHELEISDPDTTKEEINKLIKAIKDTPEENILSTLVVRSMKKAYYSTEEISHYGLGFAGDEYCHYTSPIRRYSDILIHRILTIALGNDGYPRK